MINAKEFMELSELEMYDVDGGVMFIDDVIFWTIVGGAFAAGFAGGVAAGISRRNRK